MNRWVFAVPLAGLVLLAALAAFQLYDPDRSGFERVERSAPDRAFAPLRGGEAVNFISPSNGEAVAVNLFASWCGPCEVEHPLITQLSEDHPGRVYGVLYKDEAAAGEAFLSRLGDPYAQIVTDPDGQGGLDFGLTGVPETFVIGGDGTVRLHVRGPLDQSSLKAVEAALAED